MAGGVLAVGNSCELMSGIDSECLVEDIRVERIEGTPVAHPP